MLQADRSFQARIQRINSGKQYEAENVVGHKAMKNYKKIKKRLDRVAVPPLRQRLGELIVLPFAVLFGLMAVVAARALWFHLEVRELLPRALAEFGANGEIGLAVAAAFFFMIAFRLRSGKRFAAVLTGFAAMVFAEDSFAESLPWLWQTMFSPEYAAAVTKGGTLASAFL